jgi:hypothetical protein
MERLCEELMADAADEAAMKIGLMMTSKEGPVCGPNEIATVVRSALAAERERCAKFADDQAEWDRSLDGVPKEMQTIAVLTAVDIAKKIRSS